MSDSGSEDDLDLVDGLLEEQFQETNKRRNILDDDEAFSNGECTSAKRIRSETGPHGDSHATSSNIENGADGDDDDLKEPEHQVRTKIVLKKPHQDYFEMLPEGWIEVTHHSGMPIYLHKASRVCSVSKPYFLGPGSVRKHDIPISAIPCLQYRKQLEEEREKQSQSNKNATTTPNGQLANVNVKVQSVEESKKQNSLDYLAVREYCKAVFEFQEIKIRKFKTWADRRTHAAIQKRKERPSLPEGTKLITCPINPFIVDSPNGTGDNQSNNNRDEGNTDSNSNSNGDSSNENASTVATLPKPTVITASSTGVIPKGSKREFIMNPAGKSYVCILHEFIQHTRRVQPSYKFEEVPNAATPYSATVVIDDIHYGTGFGSSKKTAKSEAAKQTLSILIPDYSFDSLSKDKSSCAGVTNGSNDCHDTSSTDPANSEYKFFDGFAITDERVPQICAKTGQYSPFQILVECLKRNHGMGSDKIGFNVDHSRGNQMKNKFTMTVGKHNVVVTAKNKTEGKQKAAQAILALLHQHQVTSWGGLLRLYGRGSCKTPKEKKEEEQKITELQSTACANRPNYAILNKLREQMEKLRADKEKNVSNQIYISPLVTAIEGLGDTVDTASSANCTSNLSKPELVQTVSSAVTPASCPLSSHVSSAAAAAAVVATAPAPAPATQATIQH